MVFRILFFLLKIWKFFTLGFECDFCLLQKLDTRLFSKKKLKDKKSTNCACVQCDNQMWTNWKPSNEIIFYMAIAFILWCIARLPQRQDTEQHNTHHTFRATARELVRNGEEEWNERENTHTWVNDVFL